MMVGMTKDNELVEANFKSFLKSRCATDFLPLNSPARKGIKLRYLYILILCILCLGAWSKQNPCVKTIITANKTDMKAELKRLKGLGWKPKGKLVFKEYAFHQTVINKKCEKPK